jgi:osmotically-inducible protein OsmY
VDAANIAVKNMNGEVALHGTVPSYPQYRQAATAARRVAGVKNVHNDLEVVLPTGQDRDDATLTSTANDALALNITVPDGVKATARDGNLKLTGAVSYGSERAAAELAVAVLTGVRNIKGEIQIAYDADPADVTLLAQDALDRNALILDDSGCGGGHPRPHGHADRPRPDLGRARRGGRRPVSLQHAVTGLTCEFTESLTRPGGTRRSRRQVPA